MTISGSVLTEYDVINPGGGKGIYGKVHFKNLAIGIMPWMRRAIPGWWGNTVSPDAYSWEIPEGGRRSGRPAG